MKQNGTKMKQKHHRRSVLFRFVRKEKRSAMEKCRILEEF